MSELKIIWENSFFVALDKPSGWLSVPSRFRDDPRPCAGAVLQLERGAQVWPVHRLDEAVSGILLFAKTAEAHKAANQWFENRQVSKRYQAWTEGAADGTQQGTDLGSWIEWRSRILRGKKRAYESNRGKDAITRACCNGVREWGGARYLEWFLEPLTGRSHQLRFELHRHGFPIAGDTLYGAAGKFAMGGIALRAIRLSFGELSGGERFDMPLVIEATGLGDL